MNLSHETEELTTFLEGHGEESSLRQDRKEWTAKEGRGVFGYTFVPFRSHFPASKTNLLLPSLMQHQLHTGSDQLCTGVTWHPPSMGLWLTGPGPLSQSSGCTWHSHMCSLVVRGNQPLKGQPWSVRLGSQWRSVSPSCCPGWTAPHASHKGFNMGQDLSLLGNWSHSRSHRDDRYPPRANLPLHLHHKHIDNTPSFLFQWNQTLLSYTPSTLGLLQLNLIS